MCPAAGIFHSIWTQCTTSNMGSQIFVFLMGRLIRPFWNLVSHAGFCWLVKITAEHMPCGK